MGMAYKKLYKLSPSDFRYLWKDCKHCFYQKVKYGIALPSIGLPGVFSKMNSLLQNSIQGKNLHDINPTLPPGRIEVKEGYLKSAPIPPAGDCFISGRFDIISRLDNGTFALIDFKITDPSEEKAQRFTHQLHAYKFALENPISGFKPKKVAKMGLIAISPNSIEFNKDNVIFKSEPKWFGIEENMEGFYKFIAEVADLLNGPAPQITQSCDWCKYRICFSQPISEQEDIPF